MAETLKTVSRFLSYTDKICRVDENDPESDLMEGDVIVDISEQCGIPNTQCIMRFHHGYLWGLNDEPAIECTDSHTEFWEAGKISCSMLDCNGNPIPAVISIYGAVREYWKNGKQLKVITA